VFSLPKKLRVILPNNRMNAARRLSSLRERLYSNEALKEICNAHMLDYIMRGQLEVAPHGRLDNGVLSTASGGEESEEWEDEVEDSVRRLISLEQRTFSERGPGNGVEHTARDSRGSTTIQIASPSYRR
jgi:hypothetical protein